MQLLKKTLFKYKIIYVIFIVLVLVVYLNTRKCNEKNDIIEIGIDPDPSNRQSIELYKLIELPNRVIKPTKYILFWTKYYGTKNWDIVPYSDKVDNDAVDYYGPEFFENFKCPETNCILTSNRSVLPNIYDFDALIFHATEPHFKGHVPPLRSPHQYYVMASQEPPSQFRHAFNLDDNFYNWTMTYKINSDVFWPYFRVRDILKDTVCAPTKYPVWRPSEKFHDTNVLNIIQNKKKLAVQFISHCNAISHRDELTFTLKKYLSVDVYGLCGTLSCDVTADKECDNMYNTDYKFYLAFENAFCENYVTEKLFEALNRWIVPVVYGGANYTQWIPPKSYINANDYETVEALAKYLIFLDQNPKEYMQYFWWKQYYRVEDLKNHCIGYCNLCTKLHSPNLNEKVKYYTNIKRWFNTNCPKNKRIDFV